MRYPADASGDLGETVTTTYLPQKLVNSVIGTNTYVKSSTYDAAGRVDVRLLGDSSGSTRWSRPISITLPGATSTAAGG